MGYPLRVNKIRTEKLLFPKTGGKFGSHVRGSKGHTGWDLSAPKGTAVYAVGSGKIIKTNDVSGYGKIIQLKFIRGSTYYWALYAHLSESFVSKDDPVAESQIIGLTGNTGNAKNQPPHLHFEIATSRDLKKGRKNQIDPGKVLGSFLGDHSSGEARVIESSYGLDLDDIELAQRIQRTT